MLERSIHAHALDRLVEQMHQRHAGHRDGRAGTADQPQRTPWERRQRPALALGAAATLVMAAVQHGTLTRLVSSTRHTSCSKLMPAARAAIGTRLWSVMPGTVLISSSSGLPVPSIMKSARPQPSAPHASKAASARLDR